METLGELLLLLKHLLELGLILATPFFLLADEPLLFEHFVEVERRNEHFFHRRAHLNAEEFPGRTFIG